MKKILFLPLLTLFPLVVFAQAESDWIFDDSVLPEVRILIDQNSLNAIYTNVLSDQEYPATFIFIKGGVVDTVENIGFRLRGNTSRFSQKKSFKISFDTFVDGREYYGLDKMNLNGEHNDPSIIRSKLSWTLFEMAGIRASRANHVTVYINDEYYGLYINVEHIDNEFVEGRFGSDAGNLYKCYYGADLHYLGPDQKDYKLIDGGVRYELKTNQEADDYSDLVFLTYVLSNNYTDLKFEQEIEDYLDVDGVLRWMAVDILTGMWDNYWFNKNNFYLYKNPVTKRFHIIPYDYDNTFGIWWNGILPGTNWGTRDINNWGHPTELRPLTNRLLEIDKYRDRLHFYIDTFIDEFFNEASLFPEIDRIKALTQAAAEADIYRTLDYGFDVSDYHNSFTQALGAHVTYGLKSFISARVTSALQQVQLENIYPVFRSVESRIFLDDADEVNLFVQAEILDESTPSVTATVTSHSDQIITLVDDGSGADQTAADGIYTASQSLGLSGVEVSFFIQAEDPEQLVSRYPNNPNKTLTHEFGSSFHSVVVNEFMADNETVIQDESGAFEDWIELYNPTDKVVNLSNYFLTDDFNNPEKWALPDTSIPPGGFLLIWADNDDEEGPLHTNFGLNNDGERIGVYLKEVLGTQVVDTVTFGPQSDDISYGRETDGANHFVAFSKPTPGHSNDNSNTIEDPVDAPSNFFLHQNYPNPFNPTTAISFQLSANSEVTLTVYDMLGREVAVLVDGKVSAGLHEVVFNGAGLSSGIYFYRLITAEGLSASRKLTLLK